MERKLLENNDGSLTISKRGRFQEPCNDIYVKMLLGSETALDFQVTFSNHEVIKLSAKDYIVSEGDKCTILMEKSDDDEIWVLGLTITRYKSITVKTTGSDTMHYFVERPQHQRDSCDPIPYFAMSSEY
ncbi:unnamed protein product [Albugo candida]|uniref:Uncharacterized protein n=1 Tax=Albugo candida TaxID=65357 RepID=A0A024FY90_9STRA|nr:unnamed protein product [Albugo candida]|eukprot:CCI11634.1 unnamed protein product [Albugo candida]